MPTPTSPAARPRRDRTRGFTLVELLLVISLLSIISMVAVPRFGNSERAARVQIDETNIAFIDLQWETKRMAGGEYGSLTALLADPDYFPDGAPQCPFGAPYADTDGDHRVDPHTH